MADFDFPNIGLLIDDVKRPDGSYLFDRSKANKDGTQKSAFQKQHVHPTEDMLGLGQDFIQRISASTVDPRYRFNGSDFSLNGGALPVSDADALRLGISTHRGGHPQYTKIVRQYRESELRRGLLVENAKLVELLSQSNPPAEADARVAARKFADDFMAREWKGVENTLRLAAQVDGVPEAGIGHRPGLVQHDGDPFRVASGFPDAASYNADFLQPQSDRKDRWHAQHGAGSCRGDHAWDRGFRSWSRGSHSSLRPGIRPSQGSLRLR